MLDLTVVDMLLSDHFVISLDLLLRKPVREKRKIISRNIRAIDMHDFRTDVHNLLGSATQSDSTDPLGVYNTCLRQLLDRHGQRAWRWTSWRRIFMLDTDTLVCVAALSCPLMHLAVLVRAIVACLVM